MRHIQKQREPAALTSYRSSPGARYDGDSAFPQVKDEIRRALVAEQRGLCCFCEMRVQARATSMRIAHRIPQSVEPQRDLDWKNLLAACLGNEGSSPTHCDVAQHNTRIALDPTQKEHCATLSFNGARLESRNPEFSQEIDDVLALNSELLQERRQKALEQYLRVWFEGRGTVGPKVLERMRTALEGPGELPPYVSFLKGWLDRHIKSR